MKKINESSPQWEMFWALQLQFLSLHPTALDKIFMYYYMYDEQEPRPSPGFNEFEMVTYLAFHLSGLK